MMFNRLSIKVTKFHQSMANRFLTVAKKLHWGKFAPPPYKLGFKNLAESFDSHIFVKFKYFAKQFIFTESLNHVL